MSDQTSNNEIENGVDKFDGPFEKEESGATIFVNKTVNMIKDLDAAGLYMYLLCRPPTWIINIKHLCTNFNCGKNKIYKILETLISLKLLTRHELREKGKFKSYKYRIHLRPQLQQIVQVLPVPQKPEAVKPDAVFEDTYKTNILPLENKEEKTTTTVPSSISAQEKTSSSSFFSEKQQKDLLSYKLKKDERNNDLFLSHCQFHIENQINEYSKYERFSGLKHILIKLYETQEIFKSKGFSDSEVKKEERTTPPTLEDIENYKKCIPGYEWVNKWRNQN